MPRIFVRHLQAASDHLQHAMQRLHSHDYGEAVVCVRCVMAELAAARGRPGVSEIQSIYLDAIEEAAIETERKLRAALLGGSGTGST